MVGTHFLEISSKLKKESSCHFLNTDFLLNLITPTEYQRKLMRLSSIFCLLKILMEMTLPCS